MLVYLISCVDYVSVEQTATSTPIWLLSISRLQWAVAYSWHCLSYVLSCATTKKPIEAKKVSSEDKIFHRTTDTCANDADTNAGGILHTPRICHGTFGLVVRDATRSQRRLRHSSEPAVECSPASTTDWYSQLTHGLRIQARIMPRMVATAASISTRASLRIRASKGPKRPCILHDGEDCSIFLHQIPKTDRFPRQEPWCDKAPIA